MVDLFYAVPVVVLLPTTYENGKVSGKHIWCEWPIALICTPYIFTDISDAFATGFEERMSTFSQEKPEGFESCEDSCDGGSCV